MRSWRTWSKYGLWGLVAALVLIQFVPVRRTNPPADGEIDAPPAVRALLRRACYDCHSNETAWPWYSRVAPVSWLVASDVEEGRQKMNFSTWARYDDKRRARRTEEIWEEVSGGDMPPWSYQILHRPSRLAADDLEVLRVWTAGAAPGPGVEE